MSQIGRMIDFENGELSEGETIELFQELIDSGLAWKLQGFYGRTAEDLINAGLCLANHTIIATEANMMILITPGAQGYNAAPLSPYTSALMQHDAVGTEVHFDSLDALAAELGEEMDDHQIAVLIAGMDACVMVSEDRYNELMEA